VGMQTVTMDGLKVDWEHAQVLARSVVVSNVRLSFIGEIGNQGVVILVAFDVE